MASPLVVALAAVVLVAVVLPLWALRGRRRAAAARRTAEDREQDQGTLRVRAHVHTGWEQTLIGLARELRLPRDREDLPYGELYLEPTSEHRQYVRTRSEIGRGFVGLLQLTPHQGPTVVDYSVLRLPGDERLLARIQQFELDLVAALRRLDRGATVDTSTESLREYRARRPPD